LAVWRIDSKGKGGTGAGSEIDRLQLYLGNMGAGEQFPFAVSWWRTGKLSGEDEQAEEVDAALLESESPRNTPLDIPDESLRRVVSFSGSNHREFMHEDRFPDALETPTPGSVDSGRR